MSEHAEGSRFMRQLRLSHYQMVWFLAVSLLPMVHAAQVVATLKGTLSSGTDFTGVFGFAPNTDLTGQAFTLTFTFDDTKGTQQVTNCTPGAPQSTEILGDSAAEGASPGTAVLQIGGHSWTFGTPPNGNLNSFASRSVPCGTGVTTDRLQFSVSDVPPSQYIGDNVSVILTTPIGSPPFTTDASWEAPLSTSLLPINSFSDGNSFDIDQDGYIGPFLTPINFARGVFVPTSITISGPNVICSSADVRLSYGSVIAPNRFAYMLASFTAPNSGTLDQYKAACGFASLNWQQQFTTDPGGASGNSVQPNVPGPLIDSGNVIYTTSAVSIFASPSNQLCESSWAGCSLVAGLSSDTGLARDAPAYYDPPAGGYLAGLNTYPFYYPDYYLNSTVCTIFTFPGYCLNDGFPYIVSSDDTTLSFEDNPVRASLRLHPGSFLALKTSLVGISNQGTVACAPGSPLYCTILSSWTWTTTFNGSAGGVDENSGGVPIDSGSGTGGVTITSINGVLLPPVVSSTQITTTTSGLAYSRVNQTFSGTVTLTNISNDIIGGPLQMLFLGMPLGVTLVNETSNLSGNPYLTIPGITSLAPGQSVTVLVQFKNPLNATINLVPAVYSGSIN